MIIKSNSLSLIKCWNNIITFSSNWEANNRKFGWKKMYFVKSVCWGRARSSVWAVDRSNINREESSCWSRNI